MKLSYGALGLVLLVYGLVLPQNALAVSGCTNGYLLGDYTAQVTSLSVQNALQAMSSASTSTTGSGGTTSGTPAPALTGFGSNPRSITGNLPGAGRYYFDGAGTIVGVTPGANNVTMSTAVGSYKVNDDCTATLSLSGGGTFDAVLTQSGRQVLFVETDSSAPGSAGILSRASSCVGFAYPHSYGFSFSGATETAASTSTGTGGTGSGTAASAQLGIYSTIGTIVTDGNGNFVLTQTTVNNDKTSRFTGSGSYSVGGDCSVTFTFNAMPTGSSATANAASKITFKGLSVNSDGGVLVLQPDQTNILTGSYSTQ